MNRGPTGCTKFLYLPQLRQAFPSFFFFLIFFVFAFA